MKKLVALLLVSMMATVAFAGLDDGHRFVRRLLRHGGQRDDLCDGQPAFAPFNAYLLLMNPVADRTASSARSPRWAPRTSSCRRRSAAPAPWTSTRRPTASPCGAAANYPTVGGHVLVTWSVMLQAPGTPLEFFITKASIPSMPGNLPVVTGDGVLRRCGLATGDVTLPVALSTARTARGERPRSASFGNVKSLFR
jgi:hypothetical protein